MRRALGLGSLPAAMLAVLVCVASAGASPLELPLSLPAGTPSQFGAMVRAKTGTGHAPAAFHPELTLKTSDGYLVGATGFGTTVALEVARPNRTAVTAYVARGVATSRRLEASFGKLGRIDVRFRPASGQEPADPHPSCHGAGKFQVRRGVYVGRIRFRGEEGYVSVRAHRAKGAIKRVAPQCGRRSSPGLLTLATHPSQQGPFGPEEALLGADWRHGVASAAFLALHGARQNHYLALTEESKGALAIIRFALGSGPARAFTVDEALTFARVSPPAPFTGTGTYRAAPDGTTTWTGSLAAGFPGPGRYPLTGPPFEAELQTGF